MAVAGRCAAAAMWFPPVGAAAGGVACRVNTAYRAIFARFASDYLGTVPSHLWHARMPDCSLRLAAVSPTVFSEGPFRFYFFSREEPRMHIHVSCAEGEAKFWLEPRVSLAQNWGLSARQVREAQVLVEAHADECRNRWQAHFGR